MKSINTFSVDDFLNASLQTLHSKETSLNINLILKDSREERIIPFEYRLFSSKKKEVDRMTNEQQALKGLEEIMKLLLRIASNMETSNAVMAGMLRGINGIKEEIHTANVGCKCDLSIGG